MYVQYSRAVRPNAEVPSHDSARLETSWLTGRAGARWILDRTSRSLSMTSVSLHLLSSAALTILLTPKMTFFSPLNPLLANTSPGTRSIRRTFSSARPLPPIGVYFSLRIIQRISPLGDAFFAFDEALRRVSRGADSISSIAPLDAFHGRPDSSATPAHTGSWEMFSICKAG